jgi:hypothetical protein
MKSKQKPKQRRAGKTARYSSLTARERATRERALTLLSDLRRGEGSYSELLRKHHLDTRTARRYLGRDLTGGANGEPVRPSKSDRRIRDLTFPTSVGDLPVRTRSSMDATKLSEFFQDRDKLLRGKLTTYAKRISSSLNATTSARCPHSFRLRHQGPGGSRSPLHRRRHWT